jgi:hypothetical protein
MNPELRALYLAFVNAAVVVIHNRQVRERFRECMRSDYVYICRLLGLNPDSYLQTQAASNELAALSVYRLGLTLADILESEFTSSEVCNDLIDLGSSIQSELEPSTVYSEGFRLRGAINALFQLHLAPGFVPNVD